MIVTPGSPEMEVVVVWDGEMFKHMATDIWDAKSWLEQYPLNKPGCKHAFGIVSPVRNAFIKQVYIANTAVYNEPST